MFLRNILLIELLQTSFIKFFCVFFYLTLSCKSFLTMSWCYLFNLSAFYMKTSRVHFHLEGKCKIVTPVNEQNLLQRNTMDFDFVFMEIKKKWQETLS